MKKGRTYFDHAHQIIKVTFSFPEFVSTTSKKSVYSIHSFLKYNQF